MEELASQGKNEEPIQQSKSNTGEVSTNTSFSNYGKGIKSMTDLFLLMLMKYR